ncbi:Thioredoxin X, chloroplastic [Tetrabaena socialis]|uniref:Thioredoxin X, chloroplastic n=1 Tax=Tetrabaena socialis TaxID=47790 RepID=A0A2J7ZXA1_9CHLO|nr:Thioredoxin X, chloroplastic [Tetrabaena socialis]|eukprot:PNH04901.1 Thioredoxin X, chloroplastic [Tetrabaena socialis]
MLSTRTIAPSVPRAGRAPFGVARPAGPRRSLQVTRVTDITEAVFEEEVLKASTPVLVDFWASWCGPCKLVAPLMNQIEKDYGGKLKVVKIEHDSNPKLIAEFKVYGLPALIVFKDGQAVAGSKREGAVTRAMLEQYLAKHGISK